MPAKICAPAIFLPFMVLGDVGLDQSQVHIRNDIILSVEETKRAADPRTNYQERGGSNWTIPANSPWGRYTSAKRSRHGRNKNNDEAKTINSDQRDNL